MKIFSTKEKGFIRALDAILKRGESDTLEAEEAVKAIINGVRENGDKALLKYTERFDKVRFANMRDALCTRQEIERASKNIPKRDLDIIKLAAKRIRAFHKKQLPKSWSFKEKDGTLLGQKVTPLERVGIYVPGGKAVYPSTVLMNAIPAKVSGVKEIIMATPPSKNGINS
ncbi:MAG: histidinol dehydrogenase, partial [Deltaproteobacteria bacterium]